MDFKTNGHYFFTNDERGSSTCDIEFQKGSSDGSYHRNDSMYLWDDHFWFLDIESLFREIIPEFDMFTCGCEIDKKQWQGIVAAAPKYDPTTQDIIKEMDEWMTQTIQEYGCVNVIGV